MEALLLIVVIVGLIVLVPLLGEGMLRLLGGGPG